MRLHTAIYASSYCYICVLILLYMRPHTTISLSSYYYICVRILLYMCQHTTIYVLILLQVSSYYYICVLMLLYMRPHTTIYVPAYYYICVLLLLYGVLTLLYMWPHTTIYVSSYYCMCPHTTICVSSYYYICVSSYYYTISVSSYYYICVQIAARAVQDVWGVMPCLVREVLNLSLLDLLVQKCNSWPSCCGALVRRAGLMGASQPLLRSSCRLYIYYYICSRSGPHTTIYEVFQAHIWSLPLLRSCCRLYIYLNIKRSAPHANGSILRSRAPPP